MPEEMKIRDIVRQEMQAVQGRQTFASNTVPRHIHNGLDAPFAFAPQQTFAGLIQADLTDPLLQRILPTGWTVTNPSTGVYAIHHNFGTDAYVTVATGIQSTNEVVTPIISQFPNEVDITWFDASGTFTEVQTGFTFLIVLTANKSTVPPRYTTQNVI